MTRAFSPFTVLLIEANDEHATLVSRLLRHVEGPRITLSHASCLADGLAQLTSNRFDALLLGLELPDSPIEQTLSRTLPHAVELPIIVLSAIEEPVLATKTLQEGAQDYLCKADLSSELLYRAITHAIERKHTENRIRQEAFRKQALFDLSQHALSEKTISGLLEKAAATLSRPRHVDFVMIMEFRPEERSFLLRAGAGWSEGLVGQQKVSADLSSVAGFTLRASRPTIPGNLMTLEPVIIEDMMSETRFVPAQFVRDHGVTSGMSVIIHGKDQEHPYGVLAVYSSRKCHFNADDAQFLQGAANALAAALLRIQLEEELVTSSSDLKRLNAELESRVLARTCELEQSQTRLRALATELHLAEQRERKRVATELHDHLAQMLVLGRLKVAQAKRIPLLDSQCLDLLSQTEGALDQCLTYARTLVANLSPSVLYEHGLPAGISWLAKQMRRYDLTVKVEVPDLTTVTLPEEQAVLVFQSVRELLMNIAKHASSSQAEVVLEYMEATLRVRVRDYGVGFDMAAVADASSSANKFGLFSIRERMKAVGGSFDLHSEQGRGTMAVLTLPLPSGLQSGAPTLEQAVHQGVQDEPPALELLRSGSKDPKVRVLLVDDHAMIRQGLRSVLETYPDMSVVGEAGDGVEAVNQIERVRPSVVVMDINMPRMNGIEATARIKARHPDMVVIGLSVNASGDNQNAMRVAGASVLLTKEAAVEQLHQAIQEATRTAL